MLVYPHMVPSSLQSIPIYPTLLIIYQYNLTWLHTHVTGSLDYWISESYGIHYNITMGFQDHYAVLGLESTCTSKDITKSYRKLALKHHPDKNEGNPKATKIFQKISNAHDVLKDEIARQRYGIHYQQRKQGFRHEEQAPQQPQPREASPESVHLDELLNKMAMISSVIQIQREEAQRLKEMWQQVQMGIIPEQFQDFVDFGGDNDEVKISILNELIKSIYELTPKMSKAKALAAEIFAQIEELRKQVWNNTSSMTVHKDPSSPINPRGKNPRVPRNKSPITNGTKDLLWHRQSSAPRSCGKWQFDKITTSGDFYQQSNPFNRYTEYVSTSWLHPWRLTIQSLRLEAAGNDNSITFVNQMISINNAYFGTAQNKTKKQAQRLHSRLQNPTMDPQKNHPRIMSPGIKHKPIIDGIPQKRKSSWNHNSKANIMLHKVHS